MHNCTIEEPLVKLQYQKKPYMICPIHDGQSLLLYWYCVISKNTYENLNKCENIEAYEKLEDELTNKAVDIRKLENYDKELTGTNIIFQRKELIVPLIREAVRQGYIRPI